VELVEVPTHWRLLWSSVNRMAASTLLDRRASSQRLGHDPVKSP